MPQFLTLMQNWDQVTKALGIELDSTGLATQRFGIYLTSLEATTNRFTTAWEKLVTDTTNSNTAKSIINLGTAILKLADALGIANIAIVALSIVLTTKLAIGIPGVTVLIFNLITSLGAFTVATEAAAIATETLTLVLTGLVAGVAIIGLIALFNELTKTIVDTYNNFEKLKAQADSNQSELKDLTTEYETLASKQNKTSEEIQRLLEIQTIANAKYDAAKQGINLYSDAIDNNSKAIQDNIEWLKAQAEQQQKNFLQDQKAAYLEAKKFLTQSVGRGTGGPTAGVPMDVDEYKQFLSERIAKGEDILGISQKQLDNLNEQTAAAKQLVAEYDVAYNLLHNMQIPNAVLARLQGMAKAAGDAVSNIGDLANAFDDLKTIVDGPLRQAYNDFAKQNVDLQYKAAELEARISEALTFPSSSERDRELFNLNQQLDTTRQQIRANADEYDLTTQRIIFDTILQRISQASLSEDIKAAALTALTAWGQASGLISAADAAILNATNSLVAGLLNGTITTSNQAIDAIIAVQQAANAAAGDYYITFHVNTVESVTRGFSTGPTGDVTDTTPKPKVNIPPGGFYPGGFSGGGGGGKTKQVKEEQYSLQDLYNMVISKIRQEKEAEKDLLKQHQDVIQTQRDALKQQLDSYKEIIDAKKESLQITEDELSYQEEIAGKNKDIAKIQNELAILALDNSQESKAKQLELQEQLNQQLDDLAKTQRQHSTEEAQAALDADYEKYQKVIDAQDKLLESQSEGIQTQIDAIDEFLSKSGLVAQAALDRIKENAPDLYKSLIEWNKTYGTGIDQDVTKAWNEAYKALKKYKNLVDAISGSAVPGENNPAGGGTSLPIHHTGLASGPIGGINLPQSETLVKALKGELVLDGNDIRNAIPNIANMVSNITSKAGGLVIGNLINVEGNIDRTVIPALKEISKQVINDINNEMLKRGFTRNARSYQI